MNLKLHKNARTTPSIRKEIQSSSETIVALAKKYGLSRKTVRKWKNRTVIDDETGRPNKLNRM
ncbi:Integrase catalytic domain-containing protein [groundwater metagenome]|uniref:Integrase catalytic domain-containing protein n=1 Tax=groundwater metagenome TaxID=717931 RepID=A0A098ECM5_9ZZZZ